MILVRVRQHEADQVGAPLDDELGIGHQHVDTRRAVVPERDAKIDHQPLAGIAVEIEVHADLAGTAQRDEKKLGSGGCHLACSSS